MQVVERELVGHRWVVEVEVEAVVDSVEHGEIVQDLCQVADLPKEEWDQRTVGGWEVRQWAGDVHPVNLKK